MPKSTIGLLVALCLLVALVVLVVVIYLHKRKVKGDIFDEKSGIIPIVTTGLFKWYKSNVELFFQIVYLFNRKSQQYLQRMMSPQKFRNPNKFCIL